MEPEKTTDTPPESPPDDHFGRTNWILLGVGLLLLVVGYVTLSMANEDASNLPGLLSPFIILGGYATIFVALILRTTK